MPLNTWEHAQHSCFVKEHNLNLSTGQFTSPVAVALMRPFLENPPLCDATDSSGLMGVSVDMRRLQSAERQSLEAG